MNYEKTTDVPTRRLRYRLETTRTPLIPDTTLGVVATAALALTGVALASFVWGNDPGFDYWAVVITAIVLGRKVYRLRQREQSDRR